MGGEALTAEDVLTAVGEAAGRAAGRELAAWRRAHPQATLTELELAVEGALAAARAQLLGRLAGEQEAAEGAGRACPHCGAPLVRRGRKPRAVLIAQRAAPLRLGRTYWQCSSCGTSLFPPG
ncbi:MAG TPA: hypothetical protein VFL91_24675 [Thermomicrobiales bacterium]|nr:hypothetical protein [Thermomicrobiales bacterium]